MNKRAVDELLPKAYEIVGRNITKNGVVDNGFRGQISTFGAAITMGSLLSAVCFFSKQAGSDVDRSQITKSIGQLVGLPNNQELFEYLKDKIYHNEKYSWKEEQIQKEKVINATIALKLALNLYKIDRKEK